MSVPQYYASGYSESLHHSSSSAPDATVFHMLHSCFDVIDFEADVMHPSVLVLLKEIVDRRFFHRIEKFQLCVVQ